MDPANVALNWLRQWEQWDAAPSPLHALYIYRHPDDPTHGLLATYPIPVGNTAPLPQVVALYVARGFSATGLKPHQLVAAGFAIEAYQAISHDISTRAQLIADGDAGRIHTRPDRQECMHVMMRTTAPNAPMHNWSKARGKTQILAMDEHQARTSGAPADYAMVLRSFTRAVASYNTAAN